MSADYSIIFAVIAIVLDYALGEPRRWHPLVGFGRLAARLEAGLNRPGRGRRNRCYGLAALLLLILPLPLLLAALLSRAPLPDWLSGFITVVLLYLTIAPRSLEQHAIKVRDALSRGDLGTARVRCGYMVSRDTSVLDQAGLCKATIESVLENGNDALFGPLFWFFVAGAPGALAYRLINTLDAMWGYKNRRFLNFGWAAAKLDDLVNWLPARCCSLCYSLAGDLAQGISCWRRQSGAMASPNAGPVMASGAGALHLSLGRPARYAGPLEQPPVLGFGPLPSVADITSAIRLLRRALLIFLGFATGLTLFIRGLPWV